MFGCVAENALKNPFLSCFSHFFRIQTNIIIKIKNKKKLKSQDRSGRDRFVGSSMRMRDGSIGSWVRGAILLVLGCDSPVLGCAIGALASAWMCD